jgi:hypothetical protein
METSQTTLFIDDVYEALREAVRALGGSKVVGHKLWPHQPVPQAARRLDDCLNRTRNDKLDPEQVLLILRWAREVGFHAAKHWLDEATGYMPSQPSDPKEQQDRAVDAVAEASAQLARAITALDRLQGKSALRSAA